MGNENSSTASTKNSVSSLPPICINESSDARKNMTMRRASDERQNQLQKNHKQQRPLLPQRHSTSNTHLNLIATHHLEPQRKFSQCQPGRYIEDLTRQSQRHISDSQCSLSASPSAYTYRSRASFASVGPSLHHLLSSTSSQHQSKQCAHLCSSASSSLCVRPPNRRMSVDESQHRRQAKTSTSSDGPLKFSLVNFHGLNLNADQPAQDDNQPRSRSRMGRDSCDNGDGGGINLQEQLKLSSYQIQMLTQTWPRIKLSVFNTVFKELSQKCPKVKELFQKTSIVGGFSANKCVDMKEHIKLLVELYDDKCIQIGESHFLIAGPSASGIWDDFGVCLTEAISKAEAVRGKREAFKAYIVLTSFLVDSMKAGYMAQAKRKSLSRTVNGHLENTR